MSCPGNWQASSYNSNICYPACPSGYTFKNPGTGIKSDGTIELEPSCVSTRDARYYVVVAPLEISAPTNIYQAATDLFANLIKQADERLAAAYPRPAPARTCPVGWFPSPDNAQQCYVECPSGYTFQKPGTGVRANGQVDPTPSCVFNTDSSLYVPASSANINASQAQFTQSRDNFNARINEYNQNVVGRKQRLAEAKEALLTAEGQRGTDPSGYQRARVNYYTLLQGSGWTTDEETRVIQSEVRPQIDQYLAQIQSLTSQISTQNDFSQTIKGSTEKILGSKDDFKYMANAFSEQLDKLKAETEKQKREAADRKKVSLIWFDNLLNWAIILFLVAFIALVGYYAYESYESGSTAGPVITIGTKPTA